MERNILRRLINASKILISTTVIAKSTCYSPLICHVQFTGAQVRFPEAHADLEVLCRLKMCLPETANILSPEPVSLDMRYVVRPWHNLIDSSRYMA